MHNIVVIENNETFLKLFLRRLHPKAKEDITYHFVVDPPLINKIEKILLDSDINWEVIPSNNVFSDCQEILDLEGVSHEFMMQYRISLKILAPLYFQSKFDKFMIIDDDVLILKDPKPMFSHNGIIQRCFFERYKEPTPHFEEFNRIFGTKFTVDQWNERNMNGIVLVESKKWKDWAHILRSAYTSPYLMDLFLKKRDTQFTKRTSKLFFVDLHLYGFKAIQLQADVVGNDEVEVWLTVKQPPLEKVIKKKRWPTFIHYSCGKGKDDFVKLFNSDELDPILEKL